MTGPAAVNSWVVRPRPLADPALRLFCIPYAGGAAHLFQHWAGQFGPDLEVCAVNLPGRGRRFGEPAHTRMEPLVRDLAAGLRDMLDRPFALFGHSMGGLIAFELARTLSAVPSVPLRHVFVSGANAPQLPRREPLHALPDAEFIAQLRRLNGIDPAVLVHAELLDLVVPIIRRDFELVETYPHRAAPPLRCALSVFGGADDWLAPPELLSAWRQHTDGPFQADILPGDHFFLDSARPQLLHAIAARLAPAVTA